APAVTCTATTTTVTLTATNGVGTLQYETIAPSPVIIAKQTSNTFANLAPGTYMFKVTDANGCFYTESFTVKPVTPITAVASKLSDVLCNGGNTGSIRLTVGGFASTYSYTVNGGTAVTGVSSTTVTLPNLVAGNYAIVVTDEATGCTAPVSMTISQPAAALSATYAAVNGNCSVSTSAVTVTATGGTPVYRYSFVQDGAAVGTYTNSNKANLDPAVNLNWDVYIIDANNCTFKLDITITKDPVPTVTASATGQCFGVGSYTITATPGTGLVAPLSYSIDNGASYQAGNTFVITTPGSYTVKIKDGNGCTANSNVVIVDNILGLTAALDKNITCSAPTAAQVTLTANGGSAPYTYESKEAAGAYTAMASNVFNTMTPGSYTFRVTDAKGCKFETATPIIITAPVNPDITGVTQTAPISCSGDNTAAISITLDNTKGQAPFVYTVLNTTTGVNYGTQTSGLAAGNYTITVTDAKGCTDTFPIVITQPAPIVIDYDKEDLLCVGGGVSKGKIIINSVTGGTQNYNYYVTGINNYNQQILNVPGTSAIFEVVDFGLYQIRVVDINGCSETVSNVTIAAPPNYLDINIATTANCTTGGTAVVTIGSAFPSTGPFHFNVYTGPGQIWTADGVGGWQGEMPANSKSTTFTNLTPGVTYTFIVYDQITKCYYYQTATTPIPTLSTLSISNEIENNITCTNAADGKISFTITSTYATTVNVTYQVYEALTNLPIAGISGTANITAGTPLVVSGLGPLTVGSYYVLIKETSGANTGCGIVSSNFNIKESPVELSLTASVSKNANCNPNSGVITAIAKDGTAPYTYQLLLASAPAKFFRNLLFCLIEAKQKP
ncbi:chromophore lyase, partial [Flavobacterium sp. LBUM151]